MGPRRALLTGPLKPSRHTVYLNAATELESRNCSVLGAFSTPRNHLPGLDSQFMCKPSENAHEEGKAWWTHRVLLDVIAGRQVGVPEQRGRPAGNLHWATEKRGGGGGGRWVFNAGEG